MENTPPPMWIRVNTSIETGQFPDSWKVARVTPILKDGEKTNKSNYRPISVLPAISRLFEKLVSDQLYNHMNENGQFSNDQSGFLNLVLQLRAYLKILMTGTMGWTLASLWDWYLLT